MHNQTAEYTEALKELRINSADRMVSLGIDRIRYYSSPVPRFDFLENYKPKILNAVDSEYFEKLLSTVGLTLLKENLVDYNNTDHIMIFSLSSFPPPATFEVGFHDGWEWKLREVNLHKGTLDPDWDAIMDQIEHGE